MADPVKLGALGSIVPEVEVAVIGGGLGGLALAIGLQKRGVDAHVFESAQKLRTDSGTVISIAANGQTGLDGLFQGLSEQVKARGSIVKSIKHFQFSNGKKLAEVPGIVNPNVDQLIIVSWRAVQETLSQNLKPDLTHCGHKFLNFTSYENSVEAEFEVTDGNGAVKKKAVRAKLLVGADGIRSNVRKAMVGDEPRFLRNLGWNALVPNAGRCTFGGHEDDEIITASDAELDIQIFFLDAGEGYSFWQVKRYDRDLSITNKLGDSWGGFGKPGAKERALSFVEKYPDFEYIKAAIIATDESLIFERKVFDRLPIDKWSDNTGRVVLLGDAAHAMNPGPGQGARTAFEDAHQLTLALEDLALPELKPYDIAKAVKRYESVRVKRCNRMLRYAAEGTALPEDEVKPVEYRNLDPKQRAQRAREFSAWANSYPAKIDGDPDSVYWK